MNPHSQTLSPSCPPKRYWLSTALLLSLVASGILLSSVNVFAINHPPAVSWIKDQALSDQPGQQHSFETIYFRAWDSEGPLPSPSPTIHNDTPNFIQAVNIEPCQNSTDAGCPPDHGYKLTVFPSTPQDDGSATIVITATDAGGAIGKSSFTLRRQSAAVNPPVIGGIPGEQLQKNATLDYGPLWFVVDDLNASGVDDTLDPNGDSVMGLSATSDNPSVVADDPSSFTFEQHGLRWSLTVHVNPNLNTSDSAVITVTATEDSTDQFKTSTSFVLTVIVGNNSPPSFLPLASPTPSGTYIEHNVTQSSYIVYHFQVTDSEPDINQLLVTATSSNANIVPNSVDNLLVTQPDQNGVGSVKITPLALPAPSPGPPQAATITLAVTDDAYTTRKQFLYIAKNPAFPAFSVSRPSGMYNLNVSTNSDQRNDSFLTGAMHQIDWRCIEPSQDNFNFCALDAVFSSLPATQGLSINLIEEPCYIADSVTDTWCDYSHAPPNCPTCSGSPTPTPTPCSIGSCSPAPGIGEPVIKRALPWDSYLQTRRDIFLTALANHQLPAATGGRTVAKEPRIKIINPNLFGGDTGIRELNGVPFSSNTLTNYTRQNLLGAVQGELRTITKLFPGKLVQIGFFTVEDDWYLNNIGESLWHWLYSQLTKEFDGKKKPLVHFFQEDLAATRASAAPDYIPYIPPPDTMMTAYSFTPGHCQLPSFAYPCGNTVDCDPDIPCTPDVSEYSHGITFQASTSWSAPAMPHPDNDNKAVKTLNGTPNDGMEAAFNNYLSEYLEVYQPDLDHAQQPTNTPTPSPTPEASPWDHAKWAAGLQSWHDYVYHVDSTVPLDAPAGLTVARQSATSNIVSWYGVYRATSYSLQRKSLYPPGSWSTVSGCDSTSTTCTDTASTTSRYAYRVQASNTDGNPPSPWAQVAVFVSEPAYDGYVTVSNGTSTPFSNAAQPGIQAGQGSTSNLSGFVSFDTGILTAGVTVLNAKLRLKQYTGNGGFDVLGPCVVDIRKGPYNNNEALEADDFDALETDMDVTPDVALTGVDSGNWVEAELDADYISDINTTDRTQFRLWFPQMQGAGEQIAGWYSGESTGSEPHLVVQYAGP